MKAVVFDGILKYERNHPAPVPAEGEALIRVRLAGICKTDLEITQGYAGYRGIIGHEFVGEVVEVRGAEPALVGERVVGEINLSCGKCTFCLGGLSNHCPERSVLGIRDKDGAMAEYVTLPVENLHVVHEGISDLAAAFTEPLAAAMEITEQVPLGAGDRVLVMGDGRLGLLCALALNLTEAEIVLLGKHAGKLSVASEQGLKTMLLRDMDERKSFDLVVEATGSPSGLTQALGHVRPRGTVVLKSTLAGQYKIDMSGLVVDEITLVGSRCGPFDKALKALEEKRMDMEPLVTDVFPFEKAERAFTRAREKDAIKVLLDFARK